MTNHNTAMGRLALGLGALAVSSIPARRTKPPTLEIHVFEAINQLPEALYVPVWPVMQLGALAAVPVAAGVAAIRGHCDLSRRLVISGTTTWLMAKVVKRHVGRGRPKGLVPSVRVRGRAATGEGFLSGHAGIATALAAAAVPVFPHRRTALATLAATVGLSRIYVGAHLPLDVVGGVLLGLTVDAAIPGSSVPSEPSHLSGCAR